MIAVKTLGTLFIAGVAHFLPSDEDVLINRERLLGGCSFITGLFVIKDFEVLNR